MPARMLNNFSRKRMEFEITEFFDGFFFFFSFTLSLYLCVCFLQNFFRLYLFYPSCVYTMSLNWILRNILLIMQISFWIKFLWKICFKSDAHVYVCVCEREWVYEVVVLKLVTQIKMEMAPRWPLASTFSLSELSVHTYGKRCIPNTEIMEYHQHTISMIC